MSCSPKIHLYLGCPRRIDVGRPCARLQKGRGAGQRLAASGFTLLEVLTAMALSIMAAGIFSSALIQALRVAEVGSNETVKSRDQSMRMQWFRETIGLSELPANDPKVLDREPPLVGDARIVSGVSLVSQYSRSSAPSKYRFELKFDAASGETQLLLADLTPLFADGARLGDKVLASWIGSGGRFRYLSDDDFWLDTWPASAKLLGKTDFSHSQLPKAVELQYGAPDGTTRSVVVAIQDRALPLLSMRELAQ